jgi:hypothetical protein
MSAVLRMPANDNGLHLVRDTLEKRSALAFTAINGRPSSLLSHNWTRPECIQAWESIPRKPDFRRISDSTDPTTPPGDRSHDNPSKRKRSHSTETERLRGSLGKGAVLAKPSLTTSSVEQRPTLEPYQRALPPREASYFEHRLNANSHSHEGNKGHGSSTLEPPYKNVPLIRKGNPNKRNGSAYNKIRADQRCDQAGKRREFASRTRTGCGTCRRRKEKCDEAKPKCENCVRGKFECAGYTEPIPWSKSNAARASSALQPQWRMSSAEVPAHFVGYPICNVKHIPHCRPSQKFYVEPKASSGIQASRDRSVCTDKPGRKPS